MNMDKVRSKLASFDKTKKGAKKAPSAQQEKIKQYIWKPEPGEQVVRIVPYQHSTEDFPFIELKWHYDFNGDKVSYLSPSSINEPDPIVELATKLEKEGKANWEEGGKATWIRGRKLQPKLRTYVPIIVRGKESEGIKFWGFGVQVCEQLMAAINEPDYGDISDLNRGHDIKVIFKTAEEVQKDYPETKILIKKSVPVIEQDNPKAKEILELITKKQPNIFDIYTPATYEELVAALEIKIENERSGVSAGETPRGAQRTAVVHNTAPQTPQEEDSVILPTEDQIEAATAPAVEVTKTVREPEVVSPSAQKATKVSSMSMSADDFEEAFKKVTGKK